MVTPPSSRPIWLPQEDGVFDEGDDGGEDDESTVDANPFAAPKELPPFAHIGRRARLLPTRYLQ